MGMLVGILQSVSIAWCWPDLCHTQIVQLWPCKLWLAWPQQYYWCLSGNHINRFFSSLAPVGFSTGKGKTGRLRDTYQVFGFDSGGDFALTVDVDIWRIHISRKQGMDWSSKLAAPASLAECISHYGWLHVAGISKRTVTLWQKYVSLLYSESE